MKKLFAFLAVFAMCLSYAQDGVNDPSFNPPNNLTGVFDIDANNNIYIASGGVSGNTVKKMSPTGTLDPNFSYTFSETITKIFVRSNGNILISSFLTNSLVQISPSGIVSSSFVPQIPYTFRIYEIGEQNDGTIVLGGQLGSGVNGTNFLRLNATTGSILSSGTTNLLGSANLIDAIAVLPNNNIVVGGAFSAFNGTARQSLAVLNSNGTLNSTYFSGVTAITNIVRTANNDIIVSGYHDAISFLPIIKRFNTTTGSQITSFAPTVNGDIIDMKIQSNGQIVIAGFFTNVNGIERRGLARLNDDGTLDLCYAEDGVGVEETINNIELDSAGNLYFTGDFTVFDGTARNSFAKAYSIPVNVVANDDLNMPVTGNVLTNDTYNGLSASISNVVLTQSSTSNTNVNLITTGTNAGKINIAPGTVSGTYTINYKICPLSSINCHCDTAITTITYTAAPVLIVNDDTITINTCTASTINVLANDTVNGAPATLQSVGLTRVTVPQSTITFNTATGIVNIPNNLAPGQYTFIYQAWYKPGDTPYAQGAVTVNVTGTADAINDSASFNLGTAGTVNILANDKYSNCLAATTENSNVTLTSQAISGITLTNGVINVASTVPTGVYTLTYQICSKNSYPNSICDTATVTITVVPPPVLVANNDIFTNCINGIIGGTGGNITANDTSNGLPVNNGNITISILNNGGVINLTISSSGIISVPASTPYGTYVITYSICQPGTSNCATATATVCVNNGLNPGSGANSYVTAVALQNDGKILIGGSFNLYNGITRNRIARLNSDLSLDTTFNSPGFNNVVYSIAVDNNNKIIVGGVFTATSTGISRECLARLNSDGTLDTSFPNIDFQVHPSLQSFATPIVYCVKVQEDGKIVAGGSFYNINSGAGTTRNKMVRFTPNGLVDTTFQSSDTSDTGTVSDFIILPDGKFIIGGKILRLNIGVTAMLYKALANGTVDTSFAPGLMNANSDYMVSSIARTNTGDIIAAGEFENYNNVASKNIAKINSNGIAYGSTTFNPGTSTNLPVGSIDLDSNSKIIVGGRFSVFNGTSVGKILRLNQNGTLDPSFNSLPGFAPASANTGVFALKIQPDQKIIVGGYFTHYNGNTAQYVTRIAPGAPAIQARLMAPMDEEKNIVVYPNPNNGSFNIDLSGYDDSIFDISIYNTLGQIIYRGKIAQGSNKVDLNNAESGNYFITLQSSAQTIHKIISVKK